MNGEAATEETKRQEEEKIQKLINDPDEQRRRQKREKEDESRAQIMIRALPNAFFYQEIGREGDTVILDGVGQGHGIGLCQRGAKGMAESGASFREILSHYFPNTTLNLDSEARGAPTGTP